MLTQSLKRALDVTLAGAGLVLTAPVMAAVAAVVRKDLGSPVLFRQVRAGKDGALFTLWKFRSMRDQVDSRGQPRPDAERLTEAI
ncbi:MAG TPA: sugar transferase, partial [Kofleriaceae bacterium]|nr:sugar transferase [Kofleriaceae bacterium]